MATLTQLGFNIFARNSATKTLNKVADHLGRVGSTIAKVTAAGPAAGAAVMPLVAGLGALTAASASAIGGLGVFAIAAMGQVKQMQENSAAATKLATAQEAAANKRQVADKLTAQGSHLAEKADKAATTAKLAAIQAENAYARSTKGLPKSTAQSALSLAKLKLAYQDWSDSLADNTMPVFTAGLDMARKALPALTPLVKTVGAALGDFVGGLGAGVESGGFKRFIDRLDESTKETLPGFLESFKNIFSGIGGIIKAFLPVSGNFASGMQNMTQSFADWGQNLEHSQGFADFMADVKGNGPTLIGILKDLGSTAKNIVMALAPFTGASLLLAKAFAGIVSSTPGPVLSVLAGIITATMVAFRLYALYSGVATAATWLFTTSVTTSSGVVYTSRAVMIVHRAMMLGSAIATGIATAATWAWSMALRATPIGLIVTGIALLVAGIIWVATKTTWFQTAWKYTWNFIKTVSLAVWNTALKPAFTGIWTAIKFLGSVVAWLWRNVFKPAWAGIWFAVKGAWAVIQIAFAAFLVATRGIGSAVGWFWRKVIVPGFRIIRDAIKVAWYNYISPVFEKFKSGIGKLKDAFNTAKNGIKSAWDKLRGILSNPIRFFIDTVYNNGLRRAWNNTAGKIPGVPDLPKAKSFNKGGPITTGVKGPADKVPIWAQAGEYVIRAKRVRELGRRTLDWINGTAGGEGGPVRTGFALGGLIPDRLKSIVGGTVKGLGAGFKWATDLTRGIAGKALAGLFAPVRSLVNGMTSKFADSGMVAKAVRNHANSGFDRMISFVKGKVPDDAGGDGRGGARAARALRWARTQHGKGYQWGGNGNPSWDCSGFMSAIESVIRGQKPHRRWATGSFSGNRAAPGWVRGQRSAFEVGITNAGVGHTAGTLAGVAVECRGGAGCIVGKRARNSRSGMFTDRYGFRPLAYDDGGLMPRGLSLAYNGTGRPEPVGHDLPGGDVHLHIHGNVYTKSSRELQNMWVEAYKEAQRTGRIPKGK